MKSYDGRRRVRGAGGRLMRIVSGMAAVLCLLGCSWCKREKEPDPNIFSWTMEWLATHQPDLACTSARTATELQSGQPVLTTGDGYFIITPLSGPMAVKITLQGSGCTLGRFYYYCINGKLHEGDPLPDSPGIVCSDGDDSRYQDISGPAGTSESCDLSFPGDRYLIDVYDRATSCTYEIRMN